MRPIWRRCTQCVALSAAVIAAVFTGAAYAQNGSIGSQISAEFWLGLFSTVLFSVLAGYAKGLERRIEVTEFELRQQQSQINLLSERVLREHPSRVETAEHRAHVERELQGIRERLDQMTRWGN